MKNGDIYIGEWSDKKGKGIMEQRKPKGGKGKQLWRVS